MIPAISETATAIVRAEKSSDAEAREAATKMLAIWQETFEPLHKRVGEEFPEILQGDPMSVRDAWRW